jgi:hypothetical protein
MYNIRDDAGGTKRLSERAHDCLRFDLIFEEER